jgi:hypothetical protein
VLAATFMALAGAMTLAALFPAYYRHGPSLASSSQDVWYNAPAILAWSASAVLLAFGATRGAGCGVAVASTAVWFGAYLTDLGSLISGRGNLGPGSALGLSGLLGKH